LLIDRKEREQGLELRFYRGLGSVGHTTIPLTFTSWCPSRGAASPIRTSTFQWPPHQQTEDKISMIVVKPVRHEKAGGKHEQTYPEKDA
jgi:hypothetical protein